MFHEVTRMLLPPWESPAPELSNPDLVDAFGLERVDLRLLLQSWGQKAYRGDQIFDGIHAARWRRWDHFTHLGKAFRTRLQDFLSLETLAISESVSSVDGSTKHAFRLKDGYQVEGVHMPYEGRRTLCISSQVGCAMGCTFCATGQMGILRNLTPAEIVGQVWAMLLHHGHTAPEPVNLVFMGMGEPLHNLDHVMKAFRILTDAKGLAIPPRRITLSTSGLVSGIRRLAALSPRPRLALSLNGTTDEARSRIMPVNRVWGLETLATTLKDFPLEPQEKITLEYVLLKDHTDTPEDAKRLRTFAQRFPAKVNLIPFNPHEGSGFEPPSETRIDEIAGLLVKAGITVSVRRSRGQDITGACGQLVQRNL